MSKTKPVNKAADLISYRPKPTLRLDAKAMPVIKKWQVGKTYEVTLKVKMTELRDPAADGYPGDEGRPIEGTFRVLNATSDPVYDDDED